MPNLLTLSLYVQPGTSKTEVYGEHDGRIKIRLKAPPGDGKANQALCAFLAEEFCIKKSQVVLCVGAVIRLKTVEIREAKTVPRWLESKHETKTK